VKKTILQFRNGLIISAILLFVASVTAANDSNKLNKVSGVSTATYEGNVISKEGAWCWFADPRALHYENAGGTINSTYIGYIDVHGNIKATQHNFLTGKNNEVLIRSYFQPDDHDNPSFLILPDERVMIFYSRHTDEPCFYYRISKKAGDITSLGAEMKIATADNTTYPSPFIMSDDPTHIYLCWRGINWHPTIAKLSIPDAQDNVSVVWGPYQMVQSTGARPYCKYKSNGKDKIYLTYTTGHPDNEYPNWVYFNYVDVKTLELKDINGTVLSTIASGVHNVNKTTYQASYPNAVVDAPTDQRDWVWQTTLDKDGLPVIAMVQINNAKTTHNYYYAKWTGTTWRKTFLANGGGQFHQTPGVEMCYSGGMAIDDSNPAIIYCSVPVAGTSGTVYEIMKYTIASDGTIASTEQITTNSTFNNVRPFIIANSQNSPLRLTWMNGLYYYWLVTPTYQKGFPTSIRSDWKLPLDSINLANGLVNNEAFNGTITGTARTTGGVLISTSSTFATFLSPASPSFSVSLTPYIYEGAYSGTILKMGDITYGLNGTTLKPYVQVGSTTYNSMNLLGNSDIWQTVANNGWLTPTKLKYFNLTLTYDSGLLKIFRNGLIDQVVEVPNLSPADINIGGFTGWVEDCLIYNRALTQGEIKKLTETSLAYTFNSALTKEVELESIVIPQNVYTDIVLPSTSASGNIITWATNNTAVITTTGLVTLPTSATAVTLTATANGISKSFNVTVNPRTIFNNRLFTYTFDASDVYTSNSVKYVKDKSGKGNDATIYGSAVVNGTFDIKANTAAGFSSNGYATAPAGIINNLRSCTFLAKIVPANLTSAPRIFDFGSGSGNSILLRASAYTAGLKYNGGTTVLINSPTAIPVGVESKIAMSFDAKTKTTRIYLNGTETVNASTFAYEPWQLTTIGANTRNYIGRTQWWDTSSAASNIDFNGTIDDVQLYDIALTPTEIAQVQSNVNTRINTVIEDNVSVFPNPVVRNANFQIGCNITSNEIQNVTIEIINMLGETIKVLHFSESPFKINGMNQSGMYLIRLSSGSNKKVYTGKLFVI